MKLVVTRTSSKRSVVRPAGTMLVTRVSTHESVRTARVTVLFVDLRGYTGLAENLPAISVRVSDMLDALEAVAGKKVRELVRFERDARIAGIVANWPGGATAQRAARLGLLPDDSFADIIRQYIADCEARPDAGVTLKGLRGA